MDQLADEKYLQTEVVSALFCVKAMLSPPFLPFNLPSSWFLPSERESMSWDHVWCLMAEA